MTPTVILFDIDGTLISCGGAGRLAMKAALRDIAGCDEPLDFEFAGGTDRSIARRALEGAGRSADEPAIDVFLARYLERLPVMLASIDRYHVHDNVLGVLASLERRDGFAIGLGTGNVEAGARAKLRRGQLSERFAFGGFGCDHEERKRLIAIGAERGAARLGVAREACRVVIVGDTPKDVEAALAIGAECLGVGTGPHTPGELREAGATLVCDDLSDPRASAMLLGAAR